ncbi:hypothetical protein HDU67_004027 [Dinochytrium kinnereticum]|nr:hypothetical protein HDU67_004027 [Dinochytrium kinnereticum]
MLEDDEAEPKKADVGSVASTIKGGPQVSLDGTKRFHEVLTSNSHQSKILATREMDDPAIGDDKLKPYNSLLETPKLLATKLGSRISIMAPQDYTRDEEDDDLVDLSDEEIQPADGEKYDERPDDDISQEGGFRRERSPSYYKPTRRPSISGGSYSRKTKNSLRPIPSKGSVHHSRSTMTLGKGKFPHSRELSETLGSKVRHLIIMFAAIAMNMLLIWIALAMKAGTTVAIPRSLIQSIGPVLFQLILIVVNVVTVHALDEAAMIFMASKLTSGGYSMAACGFMHKKPILRLSFSNQLSLNSPCRKSLSRAALVWALLEGVMILSPFGASGISVKTMRSVANTVPCILFDSTKLRDRRYPTIETSLGVAEFIFGNALGCLRSQRTCTDEGSHFTFGPQLVGAIKDGDTIMGPGYSAYLSTACECHNVTDSHVVAEGFITAQDQRALMVAIDEKDIPFSLLSRAMNLTNNDTDLTIRTVHGNVPNCGGFYSEMMPICTTAITKLRNSQVLATFLTDGTTASIALVNSEFIQLEEVQTAQMSSIATALSGMMEQGQVYSTPSITPGMMNTLMYWTSSNLISVDPSLYDAGIETHVAILLRAAIQRFFQTRGSSCPRRVDSVDTAFVSFEAWSSYSVLIGAVVQLIFSLFALGLGCTWLLLKNPITPGLRALSDPSYFLTLLSDSTFTTNLVGTANAQEHVLWQNLDVVVKIGESVDTTGEPVGRIRMDTVKMYSPPANPPPAGQDEAAVPIHNESIQVEANNFTDKPKNDIDALLPDIGLEVEHSLVYRWQIPSWNALKSQKKAFSPDFVCGGAKWRVLLFPNGNQQPDNLSAFLDSIDATTVPKTSNWHICAQFALALTNFEDDSVFKSSTAQHRFNPNETDWGFNQLVKMNQLFTPVDGNKRPLVENDQAVITVYIKIIKDVTGVLWHNFINYDSKKETGYVGLKNQGATCYMNSLLQSLYFTTYFRKATYAIPTENDEPTKSIPLALQRVFYQLQHSDNPVGTIELTKSFGWDTLDSFMQHDVQEFNRVLQDNLESKMKGSKAEGAISRLFVGKYKSFIKCINVDFESSRTEDFYDIQLNVKGCKNLHESFVDYIAVETLDGDNKYQAEGHGLQDARKGVIFTEFPPVLHMQLKRFEYDIERDAMVKINDRHEFPTEIDLSQFLEESQALKAGPQNYILHGVLVHSGDLHGGHYCAFLRPEKDGKWFKFDDDRVVPVTEKEVMEDNYGGEYAANAGTKVGVRGTKRFTNAYMLVYVRETDIDTILAPLEETDIPEHLRRRLEEERVVTEQRKKEKEEQHLYMNVKVLLDENIREHPGFDLCNFDDKAYPLSPISSFKDKHADCYFFKQILAEKLGAPYERIRFWNMVGRQNKTVRPDSPVPDSECDKAMEVIKERFARNSSEVRFYAEVVDGTYAQVADETGNQIVIFLKYYDPVISKIEYAGKLVANKTQKIQDYLYVMLERKGLPPGTPLKLFEEIKPGMVEALKSKSTFQMAELGDGDIICFQRDISPQETSNLPDPTVATAPQYFENLQNRQVVLFKAKSKERDTAQPDVELVLSKKMVYDMVVRKLGERLGSDPEKIRLSTQSVAVARQIIKRSPTLTLQEMLQTGYYSPMMAPSVLYYEELEINVSELEFKRFLKVSFVDKHFKEIGPIDLLVLKTARASDVMQLLREKVKIEVGGSGMLRMYEVTSYRIHKFFVGDDLISTIGDFSSLYVEEVPMDELKPLAEGDKAVNVCHFNREPARGHGIPFKFVLRHGEMFSATKEKIREKIGMNEKDFAKVKFFIVPGGFGKPKPIEDGDILADYDFMPNDYVGMDHIDKSGKTNRPGGVEKAIKIFVS